VGVISKEFEAEADETEKWAQIKYKTIRYSREYIEVRKLINELFTINPRRSLQQFFEIFLAEFEKLRSL